MAEKHRFPELQTLILDRCRGVEPVNVWVFLSRLSINRREKKDRLRWLSLERCSDIGAVDKFELYSIFASNHPVSAAGRILRNFGLQSSFDEILDETLLF